VTACTDTRRLVRVRVDDGLWEDAVFTPEQSRQEIAELSAKVRGPLVDGVVLVRVWDPADSPAVTHWIVTMSGADATATRIK